jgi:hypothetical protein
MTVQHLWRKKGAATDQQRFEGPFVDYLQMPLQPLMVG